MPPDLRSLMSDLSLLLDLEVSANTDADSLEERKAFPVGTERTWASGTFKKAENGWIRISGSSKKSKSVEGKKIEKAGKKARVSKPAKPPKELKKTIAAPKSAPSPEPKKPSTTQSKAASGAQSSVSVSAGIQTWTDRLSDSGYRTSTINRAKEASYKYQELGLTEDEATYASTVVHSWADAVYSPAAANLRGAVSSALGIELADEENALDAVSKWAGVNPDDQKNATKEMENAYNGEPPPSPDVIKKSIAKIAKASQDAYDEDPVTLYRGVSGSNAEDAKKSGKLAVACLSSWSESKAIATKFTGKGGRIMKVQIPRSAILMSHRTCPGLLENEKEVVLAVKGAVKCEVLDTNESRDSELRRPI